MIKFTVSVSLLQPPHQFTNALKPLVFEIALKSPVGFRNQDEATKVTSPHGQQLPRMEIQDGSCFRRSWHVHNALRRKSRDAAGKFIADDPDLKIQAKALIAPLIHGSLISTVTANGGDKDVVKLWANIMSFGSSKKEANLFRAYRNLESIVINPNNLAGSILQYRDAIAELKSLDQSPDERQTAHMILGKIPDSLASIRDAIISTGLSSTVVTYEVVLDMIDNKAKSQPVAPVQSKPTHSTHRAENGESDAATALLAEFCKNKTTIRTPRIRCSVLRSSPRVT
ncbi:hypothetical protein KEM48_011267 [Puccinia striiformis f. sp. tritici PST-130]|nr:hypothetical protein KEM48_011267 [Puccinia striiformis f. sp. tritici PST-130]